MFLTKNRADQSFLAHMLLMLSKPSIDDLRLPQLVNMAQDPYPATPFAKKYGVATVDPSNLFRPHGKSGAPHQLHCVITFTDMSSRFTPTEPLKTILPRTAEKIRVIEAINTYQGK
jgi:hypothetical protein